MLIGIHGKIGSGKDTLANFILETRDSFQNKKFALLVKQITCMILGCTLDELESQEFKTRTAPEPYNMTYRKFMQILANDCRENIHTDIWVSSLLKDYNNDLDWVISDVRFPNEVEALRKLGGIIVKVHRKNPNVDNHFSETALDFMKDSDFDYVVDNNFSLDELKKHALKITTLEKATYHG